MSALYILAIILAAAFLFVAVERLDQTTGSPSSSNAPSSPQAEWQ